MDIICHCSSDNGLLMICHGPSAGVENFMYTVRLVAAIVDVVWLKMLSCA